ncbi:MAG: TetR/AcrR family transcriptional regulator [Acidobacteriota bacterium]|nr:TetR/AcrR family transcriptional regulator [Acidobacteriota bacterium]
MKQATKSQRSKDSILQAALELFSSQGYKATSMKEIATRAELSIGRVYHHFTNKLEIFTLLLDQYWERLTDPNLKMNQLSARAAFPDDFEPLVDAIEEVVLENKAYIMLIYIDVIEFQGEHIRRFYADMADNFRKVFGPGFEDPQRKRSFNPDADPLFAVMLTFRFFFQYFLVETSFGVDNHFGLDLKEVIAKAKQLLLHGLLKSSGEENK